MLTYSDDPRLKALLVAEVRRHQEADQIIQGTYGAGHGDSWRGCAVACSIRSLNIVKGTAYSASDHAALELGGLWPEWLARLEDAIFEGLPATTAVGWPVRFAEAVPVGVDVGRVRWEFCAYLMEENLRLVEGLSLSGQVKMKPELVAAVRGVLRLHEDAVATGRWDAAQADAASLVAAGVAVKVAGVAEDAADAAMSAAEDAVVSAAEGTAGAAERAAYERYTAISGVTAALLAGAAAAEEAYERYADRLVELLRASAGQVRAR